MKIPPKQNRVILKKQRGAAIIVALFVVALVAAAATIMITRLRTDVRRTELILNANKAYLYAQGSVAWARDQLNSNLQHQQQNKVVDLTPITLPISQEGNVRIASVIEDAQGRFNLNNLTEPESQEIFLRLIRIVSPDINEATAKAIMLATIDWISPGAKDPSLDEYYLKLANPYRSPHRFMASASEFRLVKGVTANLYAKLSPFLIALPTATLINVNNADIPVLMSLSKTLSADGAKAVQIAAKRTPFPTNDAFTNFDIIKNNQVQASKITVKSDFFLVITNVTLGDQTLTVNTLLQRAAQAAKAKTVPIWQSEGPL